MSGRVEIWDGETFRGFATPAWLLEQAERLLDTANLSPETKDMYISNLFSYSEAELYDAIRYLEGNQCEPGDPAKQFTLRMKRYSEDF
jgi:hypothetical protein